MFIWIIGYLASTLFWVWVILLGGAERLEGSAASGCLISVFAPRWGADGIRLFAWLSLIGSTFWFVIALFTPGARF